eukprot:4638926-Alexandrium_andersonii.AAC.1
MQTGGGAALLFDWHQRGMNYTRGQQAQRVWDSNCKASRSCCLRMLRRLGCAPAGKPANGIRDAT